MEVATDLSIHNLIFLSSVLVYGSVNIPSNEEKIPQPEDEYGKSKYKAEQLIERWVEEDERNKALIIRPAAIYGKDCWANVYNLINSIENNKFLPIGKGENKKAIAYIDNLYDAVFFAWDNMVERLEIYNYTDYPILTTKELTDKIYEMLGKNKPKIYIPYKIGLAGGRVFDFLSKVINRNLPISSEKVLKFCSSSEHYADKIRDKNFIQKYTVDEGLKEMIEWKKAWLKNK